MVETTRVILRLKSTLTCVPHLLHLSKSEGVCVPHLLRLSKSEGDGGPTSATAEMQLGGDAQCVEKELQKHGRWLERGKTASGK